MDGPLRDKGELSGSLSPQIFLSGSLSVSNGLTAEISTPKIVQNLDYDMLGNLPQINDHVLAGGNNSFEELGIGLSSNTAIDKLF